MTTNTWHKRSIFAASSGRSSSKRRSARTIRTSPSSACSRSSAASDTRSATRCGGCCCRRCAARPSGASASTASLHEHQTIPGVVEDVHQIIGNLKIADADAARRRREAVLRIQKSEAGPVTAGDIESVGGVAHRRSGASPLHAPGRPRDQHRAVREQGPRLRRGGSAPARPRPAGGSRPHRLDLQPGPPRELRRRRDARRPAHRLRSPHAHRRDERHGLAGRGGQLRGRARADALPVLRELRLALVGAGRPRASEQTGDARELAASSSRRRSTSSSSRCAR